ncbi:hypothetical protein Q9966_015839 [Columba livia]|nr:hypothetical protein Q9966_015839 [Columba livia]
MIKSFQKCSRFGAIQTNVATALCPGMCVWLCSSIEWPLPDKDSLRIIPPVAYLNQEPHPGVGLCWLQFYWNPCTERDLTGRDSWADAYSYLWLLTLGLTFWFLIFGYEHSSPFQVLDTGPNLWAE